MTTKHETNIFRGNQDIKQNHKVKHKVKKLLGHVKTEMNEVDP